MITITWLVIWATWKYYIAFAACICAYRQHEKKKLNTLNIVLFAPALIPFYLVDLAINWTVLNLAFGYPPEGTKSISERFEYYRKVKAPTITAKQVADFTCEKLLNTIDPSDNHC